MVSPAHQYSDRGPERSSLGYEQKVKNASHLAGLSENALAFDFVKFNGCHLCVAMGDGLGAHPVVFGRRYLALLLDQRGFQAKALSCRRRGALDSTRHVSKYSLSQSVAQIVLMFYF